VTPGHPPSDADDEGDEGASPSVRFLSLENVLQIHDDTIRHEGGSPGIRDLALVESAIAMPQAAMFGQYLHPTLSAMAAAYLFHLGQNHGFVDGNKRTAALACLLFLSVNGVADEALPDEEHLERVTLSVASGSMNKEQVTEWLHNLGLP
jgi:death on curing protein